METADVPDNLQHEIIELQSNKLAVLLLAKNQFHSRLTGPNLGNQLLSVIYVFNNLVWPLNDVIKIKM